MENVFQGRIKGILKETGILLLAAIITGLCYNGFSSDRIPLIYHPLKIEAGTFITLTEARRFFDFKEAVFIDARSESEYGQGHIRGAVNIALQLPRDRKIELMKEHSLDQNLIVYCANSDCSTAERLAGEMQFMGYKHVSIFTDGWEGWQHAGLPVE